MKSYSNWSLILVVLGFSLALIPFAPIHFPIFLTNWYAFFSGVFLYVLGITFAIKAITSKEKGFIKFISLSTLIVGFIFLGFLFAIVGSV